MSVWMEARMKDGQPAVKWPSEGPAKPRDGLHVLVQVRAPRNIKHHRKYWALVRTVVNATGLWPTTDACHRWIKIQCGHYTPHPQPDGSVFAELHSTNFAAMGQRKFQEYYSLAVWCLSMETGIPETTLEEEGRKEYLKR